MKKRCARILFDLTALRNSYRISPTDTLRLLHTDNTPRFSLIPSG